MDEAGDRAAIKTPWQAVRYINNEFSELHVDAMIGNVAAAEDLISKGFDLDTVISIGPRAGSTALHIGVECSQLEMIKLLLKNGADFTVKNADNETPLHLAFMMYCSKTVNLILQAYYTVCSKINENIARALTEHKYPIDTDMCVRSKFMENFKPLQFAVNFQLVDVIKILIENGIDIETRDCNGMTALHWAVRDTRMGLRKTDYLHKSLTILDCGNGDSTFPENLVKIIDLLLKSGCDINARDDFGRTPIFYLFDRLINRGNLRESDEANLDFSVCVIFVRQDIIRLLLSYRPDLLVRDKKGNTILHVMAKAGKECLKKFEIDIFTQYLLVGGDVNAVDNLGYTALHYACGNGYKDLVHALLSNGADVNLTRSKERKRPIHAIVQWLSSSGGLTLKERFDMFQELLKRGAYVDATTANGTTPILQATSARYYPNNVPLILCLLNWGCDVNCADAEGRTPLHNICQNKYLPMIHEFVRHGADVNAVDHRGHTPFSVVFEPRGFDLLNSVEVYSYLKRLAILGASLCEVNRKLYAWLEETNGDLIKIARRTLQPFLLDFEITINFHKFAQKTSEIPSAEQCRAELELMKTVSVDGSTTLYDVLRANNKDMAHYLSNENTDILTDPNFDEDYPLYGYLVKNKMRLTNRARLLKSARELLMRMFQSDVPDVFHRICSHLKYDDLLNFTEAKGSTEKEEEIEPNVKRCRLS